MTCGTHKLCEKCFVLAYSAVVSQFALVSFLKTGHAAEKDNYVTRTFTKSVLDILYAYIVYAELCLLLLKTSLTYKITAQQALLC